MLLVSHLKVIWKRPVTYYHAFSLHSPSLEKPSDRTFQWAIQYSTPGLDELKMPIRLVNVHLISSRKAAAANEDEKAIHRISNYQEATFYRQRASNDWMMDKQEAVDLLSQSLAGLNFLPLI